MKRKIVILGITGSLLFSPIIDTVQITAEVSEESGTFRAEDTDISVNIKHDLPLEMLQDKAEESDLAFLNQIFLYENLDHTIEISLPDEKQYEIRTPQNISLIKKESPIEGRLLYLLQFSEIIETIEFTIFNKEISTEYSFVINLDSETEMGEITDSFIESIEYKKKEENKIPDPGSLEEEKESEEEKLPPLEEHNPSESEKTENKEPEEFHENDKDKVEEDTLETEATNKPVVEINPSINKENTSEKSTIKEEKVKQTKDVIASLSSVWSSLSAPNGLYIIKSGDSFNKIATSFQLTVLQLQAYNPHVKNINLVKVGDTLAVTREAVENRLSAAEKNRLYKGNGQSGFKGAEDFFAYIYPYAKELANLPGEEQLYVSVMMAQAALESGYGKSALASPPYHNLTGIKGDHNGEYVKMWTREVSSSKESYYVLANFKKYPSYYDSLKSNADYIRNRGFYSGMWVKNAPTYKDAVIALDKSPYATDPEYGTKIMNIINNFKLYNYDLDKVLSSQKVNYVAKVNTGNSGIYTLPKNISGAILVTSYIFNNKEVKVVEEVTTNSGVFAKLVGMDGKTIGYIKKTDLSLFTNIQSTTPVEYFAQVRSTNTGIYTQPYGTKGAVLLTSYLYNWKDVKVSEEATTSNGTFAKIVSDKGNETIGWIKKSELSIYSPQIFSYYGQVRSKNSGIYSIPKTVTGAVLHTSYLYDWKDVKVIEEVKIQSQTFIKLAHPSTGAFIGWINKVDLAPYPTIQSSKNVNYTARVNPNNQGIYTSPKIMYGSILCTSYLFNGKTVKVVEEAVTSKGTYSKVVQNENGKEIGWILTSDLTY